MEQRINILALLVIVLVALLCARVKAQDVVLVDALVTLDCLATPADTLECIVREDGIVVATCDIGHNGTAVCVDVY